MKKKFAVLAAAGLSALALAACGSPQTLADACRDHGGVKGVNPYDQAEGYCQDGTEFERDGNAWLED